MSRIRTGYNFGARNACHINGNGNVLFLKVGDESMAFCDIWSDVYADRQTDRHTHTHILLHTFVKSLVH
jgi:hypothetical protein